MDDKLILTCNRKALITPMLIRLTITCAVLVAIGWLFLKITMTYGAMRIADDGNEYAGLAIGFIFGCIWGSVLFLGTRFFMDWLQLEFTLRKDNITRLVIYAQHLDVIYKRFIKTYYWTDFQEHNYLEFFILSHVGSLQLITTDGTTIVLDSRTYDGWKQGVAYLNTVIPSAIFLRLLDAIHNGISVEIFPYMLDDQGITGEGKNFLWRNLVALHRKAWGDCELTFKTAEGEADTLVFEFENTNVFAAPDLIYHLASENQNEIPILLDPA